MVSDLSMQALRPIVSRVGPLAVGLVVGTAVCASLKNSQQY